MAESSSRKNLKRSFLEDEDSDKQPPEKRVRFPKGKKPKPEQIVEEDTVARRQARDAALERARLRNLNTASLFTDDDGIDQAEEIYENDGNRTEDGIQIEAFSLDREKEEGYFDADGNYVEYVREKEDKDAWLDSIEMNPMYIGRSAANDTGMEEDGWFARDPSVLCQVGHALLNLSAVTHKRQRSLIFADDLFDLSDVPKQKSVHVVRKAIENLSGYQAPKHMNVGQYVASNVPSLAEFCEKPGTSQDSASSLKALASVMLSIQRHEFKTNHEEWSQTCKSFLGPRFSSDVVTALKSRNENIKSLYRVKTETRATIQSLLKEDGILVIPTVADPPPKLNTKNKNAVNEFLDRNYALASIASMSGCCQVTVPLGKHGDSPISVSFLAYYGGDKFLLDTILEVYASLQDQADIAASLAPVTDSNGIEPSEVMKEKGNAAYKGRQWNKAGNAAYKGRQWNKAVSCYTEAIKLNGANATYFCNRAAAYLELGRFQQAEEDCTEAILIDKKNVKAYLRRGTARESLIRYKESAADFKHALVLEPQNKTAKIAEKRLRKLMTIFRFSTTPKAKVTIPLGKHGESPISVSFLAYYGGDKFLLDTILEVYASLQDQADIAASLAPVNDSNGIEPSEVMKEKGNAAYKGRQWNKAVSCYTEAIKLNGANATYFCNRAAAYLELGRFQQAEEDCTEAILIDKKNVKAYLRRGTARESLIRYKESAADFKHALVLEPQNKTAKIAEKRLRKLVS
ncbi:hypothetical protein F2Q70_00006419 [Brassica cretica]|uniref:Amidase domain-containing protein n=1 Tax=Brassica cretica TaxID=69181 RepID=A0A8S9IRR7_BRACR|nr:hypothetical protein F2Q70_00006419 [Brassica cretica]